MPNLKKVLRDITTTALKLVPDPLARYVLKSYYYEQDLQNRIRYHIQPFRYYTPIPDVTEIDTAKLQTKRTLPGIPTDLTVYFSWIEKLKPHAREIHGWPNDPAGDAPFWFHNFAYEDFDATTWYATIRHLKPRRIIEVGCGYSSRVTTLAARRNESDGCPCECLYIEPYPAPYLLNFKLHGTLRVEKIQQVPVAEFAKLQSGDILFIDTSHVLKTQNDLCHILHQILPVLADGVYIHFHDIFTPFDYPADWLLKIGFHFNEQYALEAVLCNNPKYEILLPVHAMWREHLEKLRELLPQGGKAPAAYWIRKIARTL